jgi:uncharacterized phage protein gp47/JayE
MPFSRPTLHEIVNRIVSDLNSRVDNSTTFLRRSVFLIIARVLGGALHLVYGFLDYMKKQLFASSADSEYLERQGSEYGISRNAGVQATGGISGTGTTGITIPAATRVQSESGNVYTFDSDVTIAGGVFTADITAEEIGTEYNESVGATLSFVSPVANVDSTVLIDSGGITGGTDEEEDEDYRNRILTRKRQPPHGGAEFDYEAWALEVPGTTRSWSIPLYQGPGTIGLAFVRDDDDSLIPTPTQREEMYNYIVSHTDPETGFTIGIPVTAQPGFFVIPITALTVNFHILISPNTTVVQNSIQERLEDLFQAAGGPAVTLSISEMYEAIVSAIGEVRSKIISPSADVAAAVNQVHVLGDITYGDYQ